MAGVAEHGEQALQEPEGQEVVDVAAHTGGSAHGHRDVRLAGRPGGDTLGDVQPPRRPARGYDDDVLQDRYGRTLAGVFLPDGRLVNAEIARAGLGGVVVYDDTDRFLAPVEQARTDAETARVGRYSPGLGCVWTARGR